MHLESAFSIISKLIEYLSRHQWVLIIIVLFLVLLAMINSRRVNTGYFVLYLALTVYITLINRTPNHSRMAWLQVFLTYQYFFSDAYLRRKILNNILLFIPLGAILFRLRSDRTTLFIIISISAAIELLQYITRRGLFETDDLISNGLGGLIGVAACMLWMHICNKK